MGSDEDKSIKRDICDCARYEESLLGGGYMGLHPGEISTAIPLFKVIRVKFSMTYDREDYE